MTNWYSDIEKEQKDIQYCISEISRIANAFGVIGNETMSFRLYDIATSLNKNIEKIEKIISDKIKNDFNDTQKSISDTLKILIDKE